MTPQTFGEWLGLGFFCGVMLVFGYLRLGAVGFFIVLAVILGIGAAILSTIH